MANGDLPPGLVPWKPTGAAAAPAAPSGLPGGLIPVDPNMDPGVRSSLESMTSPYQTPEKPKPIGRALGEQAGGMGGAVVGGVVGEAAGVAAEPFLGPLGPAAPVVGKTVGTAAGITITNAIIREIDKIAGDSGLPPDPAMVDYAKDFVTNLIVTGGIDAGTHLTPKVLEALFNKPGVEKRMQQAIDTFMAGKQAYTETAGETAESVAKTAATKQAAAVKAAEPGARLDVIKTHTGATPESATAAQSPPLSTMEGRSMQEPDEQFLAQQKDFKGAFFRVKNAVFDNYGKEYNQLYGKYENVPVHDITDTTGQLYSQERYRAEKMAGRQYDTDYRQAVAYFKKTFGIELNEEEEKFIKDAKGKVYVDGMGKLRGPNEPPPYPPPKAGEPAPYVLDLKGNPQPTLGRLLAFKRAFSRIAATSRDPETQRAAQIIANGVTEQEGKGGLAADIDKAGLPKEVLAKGAALNGRYHQAKLDFDQSASSKMAGAKNPVDAAEIFMNDPARAERVLANASPQEKEALTSGIGDWLAAKPDRLVGLTDVEANRYAQTFSRILPGTPLANPKSLMYVSGELNNLAASPQAMADVQAGMKEEADKIVKKSAIFVRDYGKQYLRDLGPIGQEKLQEIERAARDPDPEMAQAKIVDDFFSKMSDRDFARVMAEHQKRFRGPISEKIVPQEQKFRGTWQTHMAEREGSAPYYAATAVVGAAAGHPSPFWQIMTAASTGFGIQRAVQGYYLKGLATEYADPLMSSLANKSWKKLGADLAKQSARGLFAEYGSMAARTATGVGIDQPQAAPTPAPKKTSALETFKAAWEPGTAEAAEGPPPKKAQTSLNFGPLFKETEQKQAENIASERGRVDPKHVDQIKTMRSDLAKGETPDVHRDLSSGRLSNAEIRKLVADAPRDVSGIFHGMSLDDAMQAFSRGSPDDKALALTPLAQKIQDEGKNLNPLQRRSLMAQLRQALGEEAAV